MESYLPYLSWIDTRHETMCQLIKEWAAINTEAHHLAGLSKMMSVLKKQFSSLGGEMKEIPLGAYKEIDADGKLIERHLGNALSIKKRPHASLRVLLGGHMDTVFPPTSPFQKATLTATNTLTGPGVVDMKGGLIIMLTALQALERSPFAEKIGWEVIINPDEEIGSPGAKHLYQAAAARNHVGLVFEPALPDGSLVGARKGSAYYTLISRGKSAHAGRDYFSGQNAIFALAPILTELNLLNDPQTGVTVNAGVISGGTARNVVPDLCICRLNIRTKTTEQMQTVHNTIQAIVKKGPKIELYEDRQALPKVLNPPTLLLLEQIAATGKQLGLTLSWKESGGTSDGNTLAAAGLPTVDNLGARGGNLHTHEEFVLLDSLVERSRLTALFLMQLTELK